MAHANNVTQLVPQARLQPTAVMGRVQGRRGADWEVLVSGTVHVLPACSSVDPALLQEACDTGARVLLETDPTPLIVGVLQVARVPSINRDGDLVAKARRVVIEGQREVQLKTTRAFVRLQHEDVELFGRNVLTRAREAAKILARMIDLN